ncbi:uncharacterized protein BKA55DRAFT_23088 [Fusarium redolens]|uniref:Uncharacterized protein n=1 Tax=Fusarium redolens TaxID=48865 RepID=A0A9P9KWF6_FUSRE|nr:uncharacterized protein BKA55DRAFT_23088 [Fusarium redolens]KAH7269791.1 hypothetical protein BKA55DRAFT_23088 [Fusarium redolens]
MRRALVEQASYFIVILRPVHTDVTDYDPLALHQRRQYQANNPIDTSSNTLGTGDVIPSHPQPHRLPVETHQRPFSVMLGRPRLFIAPFALRSHKLNKPGFLYRMLYFLPMTHLKWSRRRLLSIQNGSRF